MLYLWSVLKVFDRRSPQAQLIVDAHAYKDFVMDAFLVRGNPGDDFLRFLFAMVAPGDWRLRGVWVFFTSGEVSIDAVFQFLVEHLIMIVYALAPRRGASRNGPGCLTR